MQRPWRRLVWANQPQPGVIATGLQVPAQRAPFHLVIGTLIDVALITVAVNRPESDRPDRGPISAATTVLCCRGGTLPPRSRATALSLQAGRCGNRASRARCPREKTGSAEMAGKGGTQRRSVPEPRRWRMAAHQPAGPIGLKPGQIHWIRARKALEDREGTVIAVLTEVGDKSVTVRFRDGREQTYTAIKAEGIAEAIVRARPVDGGHVVLISEEFLVLCVPVGKDGPHPRNLPSCRGCRGSRMEGR